MIRNYFKIAWRNLFRNKLYSTINIGGLALGLAACMLIMLYVAHEYSFDRFHTNANRIFAVYSKTVMGADTMQMLNFSYASAPIVEKNDGAITASMRVKKEYKPVIIENPEKVKAKFSESSLLYADANFFQFFSFKLLKGNSKTVLNQPFSMVISEDIALKYFGNADPVGKILQVKNDSTYLFRVSGVMQNNPSNTSIRADFVVSLSSLKSMPEAEPYMESESFQGGAFLTFFTLKNQNDVAHVQRTMQTLGKKVDKDSKERYLLTALPDMHLKFDDSANIKYIQIFPLVAILILLLALVNYMSLSTARATLRAKEIGVRKVNGASRKSVAFQFYVESSLYAVLSFGFACLLCVLFQSRFFNLLQLNIDASFVYSPAFIISIALLMLFTIFTAGLYPSIVMSSFKPIEMMSGKKSSNGSGVWVRKTFTVLQFAIAVALIVCGLIIDRQLHHLRHTETGVNRENVLVIPVQKTMGISGNALRKDLQDLHGIISTAMAHYPLYKGYDMFFIQGKAKNENISLPILSVDEHFISTLGIKWIKAPIDKFVISQPKKVVINEAAVNKLNILGDPIGKTIDFGRDEYAIAGVVKNFNFQSLNAKIDALAMFVAPDTTNTWGIEGNSGASMFIRVNPKTNLPALISQIKNMYEKYDRDTPFEFQFVDDAFNAMFKAEDRLAGIFSLFIILTVLIAGMGLFGLAAFTAQQRTKEIGIRKVLGATVTQITTLLSSDFLRLVLIAFVVASPIAWYAMNRWLQNFAYRITIEWWVFILTGLLVIVIAFVTVSFQAIKAALANPVKSLRTE